MYRLHFQRGLPVVVGDVGLVVQGDVSCKEQQFLLSGNVNSSSVSVNDFPMYGEKRIVVQHSVKLSCIRLELYQVWLQVYEHVLLNQLDETNQGVKVKE